MELLKPRTRRLPVLNEIEGGIGGARVEHWDGSVDAEVFAPCVQLRVESGSMRAVPLARLRGDDLIGLSERDRNAVLRGVGGGAFAAASGMYTANFLDIFDATQLAFAFLADTVKMALYTNSIAAMSYYTDALQTAAPYNANEATGTGYSAGGYTLANKTCTQSPNGTVMFDNTVDPNRTITGSFAVAVRGAVVFDTTITSALIAAIQFGADYNVTNGTFTVQLNALGLATILFAA